MIQLVFRTILIYLILLFVMRIMGKREIGQLSSFDFVVAMIIAELAAIPMSEADIPLSHGIIPIIIITTLQIMLSIICLKNNWMRDLVYGRPTVIIKDGTILEQEMKKSRYNLDDLLTQLREKNIANPADVEIAVLESSGKLSVIPKSQKRSLTPADLHLETYYEGLCLPLIIDGKVQEDMLKKAGLDTNWLDKVLKEKDVKDPKDVFFASIDTGGEIYLDLREPPEK